MSVWLVQWEISFLALVGISLLGEFVSLILNCELLCSICGNGEQVNTRDTERQPQIVFDRILSVVSFKVGSKQRQN